MSDPPFCEVEMKLEVNGEGRLVFTAMHPVETGAPTFWSSIQSKAYTAYRTCIPYEEIPPNDKKTEVLLLQFEHTEPSPPKRYTKYVEYNGKWRRCHFESLAEDVNMRQCTKKKMNPLKEWGDNDSQVCTFENATSYLWISPPLSDRTHVPRLLQQLTRSSYTETRDLGTFDFAQLACPFQPENEHQNINCDTGMLAGTDGLSKCFRLYGNPNSKSYAINRMVRPMDDADGFFLMHSPQEYDHDLYKVITALAGIGNEIPNNNDGGPIWTLVQRLKGGHNRPVSVGALQLPLTVCPVKIQAIWPNEKIITCRAVLTDSSMLLKKHGDNKWYLSGYDIIDQIHDHDGLRKQLNEEQTYMPDRAFERQTIRFDHAKGTASKHEHHNTKDKRSFSIEEKNNNGIYTGKIQINIPRSKTDLWKVNNKSIMRVQAGEHRGMVTNHTFRHGKLEFTYTSQNSMKELDKVAPAPLNVALPEKDWIGVFSLMGKAGENMRYGRVEKKKKDLRLSDSDWLLRRANLDELKAIESLYCSNIDHDLFYEVLRQQEPQQKTMILDGLYQSIAPHIACRTYVPYVQLVYKNINKNANAPVRIRLNHFNRENLDSLRGGAVCEDDWGVWLGENMNGLQRNEPNDEYFGQWYSPKPRGKNAVAYRSFETKTTTSWEGLQQWQRAWKHLVVVDEIYRDILFTQTGDSGFAYKFIRRMKLHTVVHDYSSAIDVDEFKQGTHELQRRPLYIRTSTAESKIQLFFNDNPVQRSVRRVQEGLYSVPQYIKLNQIKISNVTLQFGNVREPYDDETSFKIITRRQFIQQLRVKLNQPQSRFNIIPHLRALRPLVGLRSISEEDVPGNDDITDYLKFLSDDDDAFDQLMHLLTGNIAYFMNRRTLKQEQEQASMWISCETTPSPIVHLMQMRQNGKLNDPHFYPDIEDLFDSDALPLGSVDQIYLPQGNDDDNSKYNIPPAFKLHERYLQWYFNQLEPPWLENDNKTIPEELCQLAMCRARTRVLAFLKWKEMGGGLQGGSDDDDDEFIFHTDETYDDDIITTELNKDIMWETFRLFGAMFPAILRLSMLPCARHAKVFRKNKRVRRHGIHHTNLRYFEIPTSPNDRKTWNQWQQGDAPLPLNIHLSSKHVKAIARRCTNLEDQIVRHAEIYKMYFPVVMKSLLHQHQLTEHPFGGIFQVQQGKPPANTCNYKWHILFGTTYNNYGNNSKRKKHPLDGKYASSMLQDGLQRELVVPHVMWFDPDQSIRRNLRKRVDTEQYVRDEYIPYHNFKLSDLLQDSVGSSTQIGQFLHMEGNVRLGDFLNYSNEDMTIINDDGQKTFSATERQIIFGHILDALEQISDDAQ